MKFNRKVEAAAKFAALCHEDQRYGDAPYTEHLESVVDVLCGLYNVTDKDVLAAAYLHDAMEDTGVSRATLDDLFGEKVASLVAAVTDEPGANRKERKAATYPKIKALKDAVAIKLADRIANVQHAILAKNVPMFKMYKKEQTDFQAALREFGVCDPMWAHLDHLFVTGEDELKRPVRKPASEM